MQATATSWNRSYPAPRLLFPLIQIPYTYNTDNYCWIPYNYTAVWSSNFLLPELHQYSVDNLVCNEYTATSPEAASVHHPLIKQQIADLAESGDRTVSSSGSSRED